MCEIGLSFEAGEVLRFLFFSTELIEGARCFPDAAAALSALSPACPVSTCACPQTGGGVGGPRDGLRFR